MEIRKANKDDLGVVSILWEMLIAEIYPDETPSFSMFIDKVTRLMETPDYVMFVAEDGGNIVAFQDAAIVDDPVIGGPCALGFHVFVLPEYRSSAVGLMLFNSHEEWRGGYPQVKNVKVMCVSRSSRMYERLGFRPAETVLIKRIGE